MFNFDFGNSWSSKNSDSPLIRGGIAMDPLVGLFPNLGKWKVKTGDKLQSWVSDNIAKKDPLIKMDRKYGLADWSKEARKVSDWAQEKPLDATALVLGGVFGGGALAGGMGGGAGAGGGAAGGLGSSAAPAAASWGAPAGIEGVTVVGSSGAAMSPGTAAALEAAAASAAMQGQQPQQSKGFDWQQMLKNQSMGGQQQQQTQGARPMTWQQKLKAGLGRIGDNMLQIDSEAAKSMKPEELSAMKRNALLNMGLGMMAASSQGAGFGESAAFGLGQAQSNLTGALQRGYENAREARQEQRQAERDAAADERYREQMDYRKAQDEIDNERAQQAFDRSITLDERAQSWRDQDIQRENAQFEQQMRLREMQAVPKAPNGYRWNQEGKLEFIPGGPADPEVQARKSNPDGKLTEGEQRALSYVSRMRNAEANLQANGYTPQGVGGVANIVASMAPGGNLVVSENFQKYQASAREWIAGMLRYDSGAAVPDTEFHRYFNTWFAQPGDRPEVIAQKEQMRQVAAQSIESGLSPAARSRVSRGATGSWSIEEVP